MKETHEHPEDVKLRERLLAARPAPTLPPRFLENVWRRIERADATGTSAVKPTWLESVAALLIQPRLALAVTAVLVVTGALLGARNGTEFARKDAQARYVAAVAPGISH